MRLVFQRVSHAQVVVEDKVIGKIGHGALLLVGFEAEDSAEDLDWAARKVSNLRVFGDSDGKMNQSIEDVGGQFLVVSQFTLHGATKKGSRPSFIKAAHPDIAIPLYQQFVQKLEALSSKPIETGEFGAHMEVSLTNDGPVTLIIDTKNKE